MPHPRLAVFVATLVYRRVGDSGNTTVKQFADVLPGGGIPQWYRLLKSPSGDTSWDYNGRPIGFADGEGWVMAADGMPGPNWIEDEISPFGIHSWSLRMVGRIAGRLDIGYWTGATATNAEPDESAQYLLGDGAWDTGPLNVGSPESFSLPEMTIVRARFWPAHMRAIMPP